MRIIVLGAILPILLLGAAFIFMNSLSLSPPVEAGIKVGLVIALIQSFASAGALRWALDRSYFIWVWGGSFLGRFVIFGVTTYVVMNQPGLSFPATLIALAGGTTLFLVLESLVILRHN